MSKFGKASLLTLLVGATYLQAQINITMNRYDSNRSAANTKETVLNASNVNPTTFGKLWNYPVDGVIFAQPLYVQGLTIPGKGVKNVLFVATMNDTVYAFDADQGGTALWANSMGTPVSSTTWSGEIGTRIGVMSTPVIDTPSNSGSMYVVAQTLENSKWVYRLHKLSLTTGQDVTSSTVISASQGGVTFDPVNENQRPGLTLVNGQIVIGFSARPHDDKPFHGWVMAYDATTLAQKGVLVTTTSDNGAGIWGSGGAPPVDPAGNFYFLTGNAFNSSTGYNGTTNFSESLLKLSNAGGTLKLSDWFTAFNWSALDKLDEDLSCNSPMLVPGATGGSQLLTFGSKTADIYVADISKSLGHLQNNNSQLVGFFHVGAVNPVKFSDGDRILGLAYWLGPLGKTVFAWPAFDSLHNYIYTFNGTSWSFILHKSNPIKGFGEPGVPISVSANGNQTGTGVVWATMYSSSGRSVGQAGAIHAFNAEDLTEIWNSRMNQSRDDIGSPAKFVIPVVANGRMYAAAATVNSPSSTTGVVQVYGLLQGNTMAPTFNPTGGTFTSSQSVQLSDATQGATIRYTTDGSTPTMGSPAYVSAIPVNSTTTIKAFATSSGNTASAVVSATYTIQPPPPPVTAAPTFSLAGGTYSSPQTVTLSDTASGAVIRYTTDGSTPTGSSTAFISAIPVNSTITIKAFALAPGDTASAVVSATYTIQIPATAPPIFSPAGGTYTGSQLVTLTDSGAVIQYTTDGSTPNANSPTYPGQITVSSSETIKAFATAPGDTPSPVVSATYTIQAPTTATPVFTPPSGTNFTSPQSVSLTDATSGASIFYTTDGTNPTIGSTPYSSSSPILISNATTIKAFATSTGNNDSAVVSASYTVQPNPPPVTIDYGNGFTSAGLTLNGVASLVGTQLQITNGASNEAASAFYTTPVNVQQFTTQFTFQNTKATADGFTFTIQGSGPNALGSKGGGLGFQNMAKSVAVKFDLYSNAGEGTSSTGLYLNGVSPTVPSTDLLSHGIILRSGDTFKVQLSYDGANLTLTITDTNNSNTFTTVFPVDIPGTVGGSNAFVGFTGGSGGATAIQQIVQWTYGTASGSATTAAPTFSPVGGTYTGAQQVTLSDTTQNAIIYCTTDGSIPNLSSPPCSTVSVNSTETINAFAQALGDSPSAVVSAAYTIQAPPPPPTASPTFSPVGGTYTTAQQVTLSDTTTGAIIYCTTDGSTPTTILPPCAMPIVVNSTETINALAAAPGDSPSPVVSATYTIQPNPPPLAIDFGSGFTASGLALNGVASIAGTSLQLTNGAGNEAGSAFFSTPVNIQHFTTQFTFLDTKASGDGFTFAIQGTGPNALGSKGGGLGFQNILKSVAVKFDLYSNAGEGTSSTGVYLNGATPTVPSTDLVSHGILLHSGHAFNVQLVYDGTNLTLTITDTSNSNTFTTAFPVDIPGTVGGATAFVGFTGGSGGATAIQQIQQWTLGNS